MEQIRYSRENTGEESTNERTEESQQDENHLDNSSKIEVLHKVMLGYQFDYIDNLRKNLIKPLKDSDFKKDNVGLGDVLAQNTTFKSYVGDGYMHRRHRVSWDNEEEWKIYRRARKSFINYLVQKINFLEVDNQEEWSTVWKNKTQELIEKEINDLGPIIDEPEKIDLENRVGLISTEQNRAGKKAFEEGWVKSPFEDVINIHFEELNQQKGRNREIKNIYSGESLSKLAEKIVDECPQIKAVVAESWIVDSPVGRRIGLEISRRHKDTSAGTGFWGQFINEKGEVKEDKIKKFIETGIPDYYNATGYMKVEDFLRKYLPKEKRGLIKLKDLSSRSLEFRKFLKEADNNIEKNLDNMSFEEILSFFNTNPDMIIFLNSEDGKKYLDLLKKSKELKIKISNQEEAAEVIKSWRAFKEEKENIYEEREVFIE